MHPTNTFVPPLAAPSRSRQLPAHRRVSRQVHSSHLTGRIFAVGRCSQDQAAGAAAARQDASCRLEWCSSARSSALCPGSAAFPAPNDPRPQPEMSTSVAVRPSRFTDLGTKTFCSPLVQHGNVFLPIARIFSNSYLSRAQRSCKREGGRWRARRRSL